MDLSTLPGAKNFVPVLWAVLLIGLGVYLGPQLRHLPPDHAVEERVAMSLLRSESMSFLVTRRTATQIVIDHHESDLWGEWHGVLWCTVTWRWGVDLRGITERDFRHDGKAVILHVPEPQLLDFAMVPGSTGFLSKSTAAPKLMDLARGGWQRQVLEARLREHALKFAADQGLMPSRQEIVQQLNQASSMLKDAAGLEIRFE